MCNSSYTPQALGPPLQVWVQVWSYTAWLRAGAHVHAHAHRSSGDNSCFEDPEELELCEAKEQSPEIEARWRQVQEAFS